MLNWLTLAHARRLLTETFRLSSRGCRGRPVCCICTSSAAGDGCVGVQPASASLRQEASEPGGRSAERFSCFPSTSKELFFVEHQVALKTTIAGDVFNILLRTSDIFFCMKSDICHVNILQPPLCTEKKKRKKIIL